MATDSGYPSSQKLPLGTGVSAEHITVVPTDPYRNAEESLRFAFRVGSDSIPRTAGATTGLTVEGLYWIEDTATPARRGDFARFETGPAQFLELPIVKIETNRFLISINAGLLPVATNTFYIMRYATQRVDDTGSQIVISQQGPLTFVLDGVDTEVEEVTATPANSIPLPVKVLNDAGLVPDFSTEATLQLLLLQLSQLNTGRVYQSSARLDYSISNVDSTDWVEVIANVGASAVKEITLFDGGGFAMELGIGAAAAEVRTLLIPPGGFNGKFTINIPAGSRLSVRAVGAALVDAGELDINLFA